jgi:organic hydroperoxide reductase OsmC/OhrA
MNDLHYYEVNLLWDFETRGTLSCPVTPDKIEVATGPGFPKGMKEKWTAEHLFVASVSSCMMSTFLLVADDSKLKFVSFESNAIGTIEKVNGKLTVTEIILKPRLVLPSTQKEGKAKRVLKMSEKAFAIANSVKTKIALESIILFK